MTDPRFTVDVRFHIKGISISVYEGEDNEIHDETWFTWDEVEEMKSDEESHVTFELGQAGLMDELEDMLEHVQLEAEHGIDPMQRKTSEKYAKKLEKIIHE